MALWVYLMLCCAREAAQEVVDEETVVDAEDNDPVAGDVGGDKSEVTTSKFPQDQQSTNQLRGDQQQMNVEVQVRGRT